MRAHGPVHLERFGQGELEGWSAMQFIETSSITIHADEVGGRCFVDVFSCRAFDPQVGGEGSDPVVRRYRHRDEPAARRDPFGAGSMSLDELAAAARTPVLARGGVSAAAGDTAEPSAAAGRRAGAARWGLTLLATGASSWTLDASATAFGVLTAASGLFDRTVARLGARAARRLVPVAGSPACG